jgi:hypothetical protein
LSSGSFSEFNAPGGGQDRIMRARFFDTGTCEAGIQCAEASEQWCRRRRRGLQLRDADHVETVLMIGQGLDLEFMRDLFIERILLRWRLFANRKHNTRVMRQIHCGKRCLQSWRRWTKAAHSGRLARDSGGAVTYAGHLADSLTKKLPQVAFEKYRLRMLQLPQYHPLSTVTRLESYRYFEFDAEL